MRGADRQKVFEICDDWNEKGQKPTLDRVRHLPGGGSFTTIQPLLKEWKESRASDQASETLKAPDDIRGQVESLAAQIWAKASARAREDEPATQLGRG